MGLLLILITLTAILAFTFRRLHRLDEYSEKTTLAFILLILSCLFLISAILAMTYTDLTMKHTIDQAIYESQLLQALVDNADNLTLTDQNTLSLRVVEFNTTLRDNQYWGVNFWVRTILSPRWLAVPFVEF